MFELRLLVKLLGLIILGNVCLFVSACSGTERPQTNASMEVSRPPNNTEKFVVGTYTQGESEGVYLIELDGKANRLRNLGVLAKTTNPSYLAMSQNQKQLFVANEDTSARISRFDFHPNDKKFELSERLDVKGNGACHIAINSNATLAVISNYGTAEVHLIEIDATKKSLRLKNTYTNKGSGADKKRQESAHMHFSQWDKQNRFLYSVDLGSDEILVFDTTRNNFLPIHRLKLSPGDGPRHLAFHPFKPFVYSNNELSNTISVLKQNKHNGKLTQEQKIDLVSSTQAGVNYASALKISADGNFLYSAIRGINRINVYKVNANGTLKFIQSETVTGDWPRDFTISTSGDYMLVANQLSNQISVLKRNPITGKLSVTDLSIEISSPTFVATY